MVQRVPVASASKAARRGARSRGASGCGRSSITGGANRTRCTEWIRCACSIASRRSATSAVTSRKLASRGAAVGPQPSMHRSRHPATARAAATRRRRRRLARADGAAAAVSRRTRSPGGGRSDTWHSRISTISAAARRSGAVSTSPTPFSSICHARASAGTASWSASAAPRVRSASGNSWLSRSAGTDFSRVTVWTSSSRSCSIIPRSAPRS